MQRRSFLQNSLTVGTSTLAGASLFAKESEKKIQPPQPFKLNYAFHDGMFKNSGGANFLDQIQFAYDNGFRAIEDNGMMDRKPEEQQKIGDKLATVSYTHLTLPTICSV